MRWHLYVVRTADNCLYAGITTDVSRRYKQHLSRGRQAAKFLLGHKPLSLAFSQAIGSHSLALKVEYRFKQLAKRDKELAIRRKRLQFDKLTGRIRSRASLPQAILAVSHKRPQGRSR